ncbi:MAG TPA: class I adenylate-forming enzyme family protein [Planctomycetota bacterium]|nr:class I adenylate-forming enzyme family protein [Planctomycetota bacterium]
MTLPEALGASARRWPDKPAVCAESGTLSFRQLDEASTALAGRLRDAGLARGDRVALWADHAPETAVALWGVWKAAAIAVPINGTLGPAARGEVLADCAPAASILCGRYATLELGQPVVGHAPARIVRLAPGGAGLLARGAVPLSAPRAEDVAAIVYTSGSTGAPKGVALSHRNLGSVVSAVIEHVPVAPEDSYLMLVPMHYVHGLMQLLVHVAAGATVHFAGDFLFPGELVRRLAAQRIVETSGTPWHVDLLVERGGLLDAELPALRRVGVVGGRLAPERIAQLVRERPELEIHVAYGQTECAPRATALDPRRIGRKPDSVGSPIPGVAVHLLDERGRAVPRGRLGEVVVEGPNVMVGYWRNPQDTARVIDERGRLHTGDLGWFDEEGDLHLAGRVDDLIKSAGERISPQEIERAVLAVPGILECVVVGVPDASLGQRIEAHVVLAGEAAAGCGGASGDATRADDQAGLLSRLRGHCARELPLQRMPRAVHVWPELPRLANGKVDRLRLARNGAARA